MISDRNVTPEPVARPASRIALSAKLVEQKLTTANTILSCFKRRSVEIKRMKPLLKAPATERLKAKTIVDKYTAEEADRVTIEDSALHQLRAILASQETARIDATEGDDHVPPEVAQPTDADSLRSVHADLLGALEAMTVEGKAKDKAHDKGKAKTKTKPPPSYRRIVKKNRTLPIKQRGTPLAAPAWADRLEGLAVNAVLDAELGLALRFSDAVDASRRRHEARLGAVRQHFAMDRPGRRLPAVPPPRPNIVPRKKPAVPRPPLFDADRINQEQAALNATFRSHNFDDLRVEWHTLLRGPAPRPRRPASAPVARVGRTEPSTSGAEVFVIDSMKPAPSMTRPVEVDALRMVFPAWRRFTERRAARRVARVAETRRRIAARTLQQMWRVRRSRPKLDDSESDTLSYASTSRADSGASTPLGPRSREAAALTIQAWYRGLRERRALPHIRRCHHLHDLRGLAEDLSRGWAGQAAVEGKLVGALAALSCHQTDLDRVDAYNRERVWTASVAQWRRRVRHVGASLPLPARFAPQRDAITGGKQWLDTATGAVLAVHPHTSLIQKAEERVLAERCAGVDRSRLERLTEELGGLLAHRVSEGHLIEDEAVSENFRFVERPTTPDPVDLEPGPRRPASPPFEPVMDPVEEVTARMEQLGEREAAARVGMVPAADLPGWPG